MHIDNIGLCVEAVISDILQQHVACHHLPLMAGQISQQVKFAIVQIQQRVAPRCGQQIKLQIGQLQLRLRRLTAPRQRRHPRL